MLSTNAEIFGLWPVFTHHANVFFLNVLIAILALGSFMYVCSGFSRVNKSLQDLIFILSF